jgi:hypothetical protein
MAASFEQWSRCLGIFIRALRPLLFEAYNLAAVHER